MPRLVPIEQPRSLFERIAFAQSRRMFGAVIGPLRVIYARKPKLGFLAQKMERIASGLSIDAELQLLIRANASRVNGCAFCSDLKRAQALRSKMGAERFDALPDYRTSDRFTRRERAALLYCEEATRSHRVADETFLGVQAHFSETEIVELTWLNAVENYHNLQSGPLGLPSDELAKRVR